MSGEEARPYQVEAIDNIKNEFRNGFRKILLWLATGAGKTFVFCRMVKVTVAKGKRCIVVVRGRKLVDQASKRLAREGVLHGVLMANHWNYRPHAQVQVCSIDTLLARRLFPPADLIIIDEAHLAGSDGYKEFLERYPKAFIVAVTATPWVPNGLRHIADKVIHPVTMDTLIEMGFLAPFKMYGPDRPDLSSVHVSSTGDYVVEELAEVMSRDQLVGNVIDNWKSIAKNLPTICFAVNVRHSKLLVERFLAAGIPAEHCDANTPDTERDAIVKRLESGETKVISNVGVMATGVDIPCLRAIILARATRSRNLFIQMCGRGTRPFPGKSHCILLDHGGNIERLGYPTDEDEVDLDGVKEEAKPRESKTCKMCFAIYRASICPECGTVPPPIDLPAPEESDHVLVEVVRDQIKEHHKKLLKEAKKAGRKAGWAHHRLVQLYGVETAQGYVPEYVWRPYVDSQNFATSGYRGVPLDRDE